MSDKLPNLNYADSQSDGYNFQKPYSEETAVIIDQEVSKLIATQYARAKELLTQYAEQHHQFCLLYTSDAADELDGVDLGGRRIIKKKKKKKKKFFFLFVFFFSSRRRHTRS